MSTHVKTKATGLWKERGRDSITPPPDPDPVTQKLHAMHTVGRVMLSIAGPEAQWPNFEQALNIISPADHSLASTGRRIFKNADQSWGSTSQLQSAMNGMLADCDEYDVEPWISVKVTGNDWAGVAAGSHDAMLDRAITVANTRKAAGGSPFMFAIHHEPSGDGDLAEWAAMQEYCSNYFAEINDFMVWSPIGNGFFWASDTANNVSRRNAMYPNSLITTLKNNRHVAAIDMYDDHPTYTGQDSVSSADVPVTSRVGAKTQRFLDWMRARNCGAIAFGEWGTVTAGTGPGLNPNNVPGMYEMWKTMRENRDIITHANYFNSNAGGSTWDWVLKAANEPPHQPPNPTLDHGGTLLTAERLRYYKIMLDEARTTYNSPI